MCNKHICNKPQGNQRINGPYIQVITSAGKSEQQTKQNRQKYGKAEPDMRDEQRQFTVILHLIEKQKRNRQKGHHRNTSDKNVQHPSQLTPRKFILGRQDQRCIKQRQFAQRIVKAQGQMVGRQQSEQEQKEEELTEVKNIFGEMLEIK